MAMIRWAFDHQKINESYLTPPSKQAAAKRSNPSWTNATCLVIQEAGHPDFGKFLLAEQAGVPVPPGPPAMTEGCGTPTPIPDYVVIDQASGRPTHYSQSEEGTLFYSDKLNVDGTDILVKTSLQILKEEAYCYSYDQYAEATGLATDRINSLAEEFFKHGTKAATDHHVGVAMHSNGFYNSMAVIMLNALAMVFNLILTKTSGARRPVIDPLVAKTINGYPMSLENYIRTTIKRLAFDNSDVHTKARELGLISSEIRTLPVLIFSVRNLTLEI